MFRPLRSMFERVVRSGDLRVRDSDGHLHAFGDGEPPHVAVEFADRTLERQLALDPHLALGEGYMQDRFRVTEGRIYDFLDLVLSNAARMPMPRWAHGFDRVRHLGKRVAQYNPTGRARRNVAHHYDIDGALYDLFLDADRQYSCAYFGESPDPTEPGALEAAQLDKKRHIAAKLALRPGHRVLDIGCGWGGLGLYLAEVGEARVRGITVSREQLAIAQERARASAAVGRIEFTFEDYRETSGTYDRVVSVGMFEHVGVNHYAAYFRRVRDLLSPDGVALIHSIGRLEPPTITNPFIAKYIFPGGYIPALSEVVPAIERSGLLVTDIEVLRLHYAHTLRAWRERFIANWEQAVALQGEEFCRMWECYLAGSEAAFRHQGLVVFQIQLARRIDTLPIRRDYLEAEEARLAAGEVRRPAPPRRAEAAE